MNLDNPLNPQDRLDAYLDDMLGVAQRSAFEQDLEQHPQLKQEVETQRQIDISLRRCYAVPDIDALLEGARVKQDGQTAWGNRLRRIGRLAAMVVVGVAAVLAAQWAVTPSRPAYRGAGYVVLGFEPAYQHLVDGGFTPQWRCETDEEFAQTFGYRLGQPVVLGALSANIEALGLSYVPAISFDTIALLATVDGQPVVVFVDHVRAVDGKAPAFTGSGLNLFKRRVGDLMLYEITPQDSHSVIDRFQLYGEPDGSKPGKLP